MCRSNEFRAYPQLEAEREINALRVYCPNMDLGRGCNWIGELKQINQHLTGCQVGCGKCGKLLHHMVLKTHIENECCCYCQYCGITEAVLVIHNQHKERCQKFPLTCPNKCGRDKILRCDMSKHRKECPLEEINCQYRPMGCMVKLPRNQMEQHEKEKMNEHLCMVTKHFQEELLKLHAASSAGNFNQKEPRQIDGHCQHQTKNYYILHIWGALLYHSSGTCNFSC